MQNPYRDLPEDRFWKKAVADRPTDIKPKSQKKFKFTSQHRLATAGSCFAQNVAKYLLQKQSVNLISSEPLRDGDPVFSGRYGNIYTARQLLQLFREAQSGDADTSCAIQREDGRFVDINRPFMEADGFATAADVLAARKEHIAAIWPMFEEAEVFVFTLGLTEAWVNPETGKVYPICPGVYSEDTSVKYDFVNFTYEDVTADMEQFIAELMKVNPDVKVLLTVSPVPLTATYSDAHVLVATSLSKSVLRVVVDHLVRAHANVFYFPSYEMICNGYVASSAYADNLRTVTPEALKGVMEFFESEYMDTAGDAKTAQAFDDTEIDADSVCDDVEIEKSVGF